MKKFILSTKFLGTIGILSVATMLSFGFMNTNSYQTESRLLKLSNSLNVCFSRVNQSFTALMIKDLSSDFLSNNFKQMTGECFSEVAKSMKDITIMSSARPVMNNLLSDAHWFGEKTARINDMIEKKDLDLSDSNIINKYVEIESLKNDIEDSVASKQVDVQNLRGMLQVGIVLSFVLFLFSAFSLIIKNLLLVKEMKMLETGASLYEDEKIFVEKSLRRVFSLHNLPNTFRVILNYYSNLESQNLSIQDQLVKENTLGELVEERYEVEEVISDEVTISCDFNQSINSAMDRLHNKAFSQGVLLNSNIYEDFYVNSNIEALDQLLFSILSFSMDQNSVDNVSREIDVDAKALGGIAFCKIKVKGYAFDEKSLSFINGSRSISTDIDVNLVILKELIKDARAKLAIKNKRNHKSGIVESEIELVFDRVKDAPKIAKKSEVVKGNKKQIRAFLDRKVAPESPSN